MIYEKFVMIGLVALLVIGIVSAFATGAGDKSWFSHKGWKSSGNHFYKNCEDKKLDKLGLPPNATETQIQEALKGYFGQRKIEYGEIIREKLGLLEDASEEEVIEALQKWREENKDHLSGFGHRRYGFHKGFWYKGT